MLLAIGRADLRYWGIKKNKPHKTTVIALPQQSIFIVLITLDRFKWAADERPL